MTNSSIPQQFGAIPLNPQWTVVRGDTGVLRIEFYENDEITPFDTSGWVTIAAAYDHKGDVIDELNTTLGEGFVEITALSTVTSQWGLGYKAVVAELAFDLQVTIGSTVWTPIIGTIRVLGDISGGSL